jgi:eukaryotic-like serine/threonine-protein kinase
MPQDPREMTDEWAPPEEFDDYVIERPLGSGRMGRVYLAEDAVLARPVAVKFIVEQDAISRQRLLIEARAVARIQHPNVVAVYRVGELDQRPYLVTEFVRGRTLADLEKPLPGGRALEIGIELARGLAAAHRRSVLHGDIKPANAILSDDGVPKLLDFGLATLIEESAGGNGRAHRPAGLVGTPDYMAPEVWRSEQPDRRADVYALGALLYELCAGQPPFHDVPGPDLPRIVQERDAPPLQVAGVDPRFAAVISRCLQRKPSDRYASGDELREALEEILRSAAGAAVPGGNPYRGLRPFEADHRALFFGRSAEVGVVIDRLRAEPFVLIAGDSGAGKSSLCRAGVLPAIGDGALSGGRTWTRVQLVPGRRPLRALAAALAGAIGLDEEETATRLATDGVAALRAVLAKQGEEVGFVIFADQLEEMVTLAEPEEARQADRVLARIAAGVPGVRLLATARADFLGRLAALPELGADLPRALYFLRQLGVDQIREVIVGPARATGVQFESEAMVEELVEATAHAEGGLPLLQFALAELWEARDRDTGIITEAALESLGGVAGALARHADTVVASLPPAQQEAARRVLTHLVTAQGTRARRNESALVAGDAAARAALDALVRGRLLVAHEGDEGATYELAHEVLVQGWGSLRRWLLEDADERLARERIGQAAAEWERLHRARDALWGARQLGEVDRVEIAGLGASEAAFVAASRHAVRRSRWTRRITIAAVPALVAVAYLTVQARAQRALDERVDTALGEARRELAAARAQNAATEALQQSAFQLFTDRQRPQAEETWAKALAQAAEADQLYAKASAAFEFALAQDQSRSEVRAGLGQVLYERAAIAERDHHSVFRDEYLGRLALYDTDGALRRSWSAPAQLSVESRPAGATVTLTRFVEQSGRLVAEAPEALGRTPLASHALPPGSYLLTLEAPGRAALRYPIVAERGRPVDVSLDLPTAEEIPAGMVYVPPGRFLFGTADTEEFRVGFLDTAPIYPRETPGYLISRTEITYAQWIEYLEALRLEARGSRAPQLDVQNAGRIALQLEDLGNGMWRLHFQPASREYTALLGQPFHYLERSVRAEQDWRRFPVTGVSAFDAQAYAAWLDRTGRLPGARLCTELEWERAGRGADARNYPHGFQLTPEDANFDLTYQKNINAMGPDEVGSHSTSRSPFGLEDMSGNAYEWTTSTLSKADEYVVRGGSYFQALRVSDLSNRAVMQPTWNDVSVGFRVCASFPPSGKRP